MSTFRTTISTLNASVSKSLSTATDSLDLLSNYVNSKKIEQEKKSGISILANVMEHRAECSTRIDKSLSKLKDLSPETLSWIEKQLAQ